MNDITLGVKRALVRQDEEMMATVPSYAAARRAQERSFTPTLFSSLRDTKHYLQGYDDALAECAEYMHRAIAAEAARDAAHVALPLDASAVPEAVMDKVANVFFEYAATNGGLLSALIGALAQALAEEGTRDA
jgi:hypothetical protein